MRVYGLGRRFTGLFAAIVVWFLTGTGIFATSAKADEPLRFNRDIRPILSNHCYQCHGPDLQARRGGLRLDRREQAVVAGESGEIAIVPQQPDASQLVKRIFSDNADLAMPPRKANKPLTAPQKALLRRWIEQGAEYEPHWSFIAPQRPQIPVVKRMDWPKNEIDALVLSRLESAGLSPSPSAELPILIRRLSLDLTGLPPTLVDVDAFVKEMGEAMAADKSAVPPSTVRFDATYLHGSIAILIRPTTANAWR